MAKHDWDWHTQVIQPHGFATIEWDHAILPTKFWESVARMPNGCWKTNIEQPGNFRELAVQRITRVNPKDCLAITPTCGDYRCVNPAHTCVTLRTALSQREQ